MEYTKKRLTDSKSALVFLKAHVKQESDILAYPQKVKDLTTEAKYEITDYIIGLCGTVPQR